MYYVFVMLVRLCKIMCFWIIVLSEVIVKIKCLSILRNLFVSLIVEENGV